MSHKLDVVQKCPQEGWAEEDPQEILSAIQQCIEHVTDVMPSMGLRVSDIAALGITNQRETTVVWDSETGEPLYNAICKWTCVCTIDSSIINHELFETAKHSWMYIFQAEFKYKLNIE